MVLITEKLTSDFHWFWMRGSFSVIRTIVSKMVLITEKWTSDLESVMENDIEPISKYKYISKFYIFVESWD